MDLLTALNSLATSTSTQAIQKTGASSFANVELSELIALSGLSDVLITSPSSGQVLAYNGSAWVNSSESGLGTVTSVSVTTANGVSGTVATATTTPAITLTLGAITPSSVTVSGLTASEIVITDASKVLTSAAVATYPSLTELTYLKGVTSAIQTQFTGKANLALSNLASVAINTTLVSDTYNTDALGTSAIAWSDLFLGSGAVIDWSSAASTSDVTLTHSANTLTFAGGDVVGLGATTATTFNGLTITANGTNTLAITAGKTLTVLKTISLTSADDTGVYTLPTGTKTLVATDVTSLGSLTTAAVLPWTGLKPGVDGEIPTFDSSGNPAFVAVGTATHVLTSNGAGAAPTFQAASGGLGYTLPFSWDTTDMSPVDATTYYASISSFGEVAITNISYARIYIPKAGTLKVVYIYVSIGGTLGTTETVSAYVRLNNTTDTTITTTATWDNANTVMSKTDLAISVAQGDYIAIKIVTPTWVTNPTGVRLSGTVYIE